MRIMKKLPAVAALAAALATSAFGATAGTVKVEATTLSTRQKYAPRHVLAIWVTDARGRLVKTLEVDAKRYWTHLVVWRAAVTSAGKNPVDALTGATLSAHGPHAVEWNCRDERGNLVPDGEYRVYIEFSEQNGKGPSLALGFVKGPRAQTVEPKGSRYFKDVRLVYTPAADAAGGTGTGETPAPAPAAE